MLFIFTRFLSHRGRGRYLRKGQNTYRRSSSRFAPILFLLLAMGLFLSEGRLWPILFILSPFLFFWFFAALALALFRRLSQGVEVAEKFWSKHLGSEDLDLPSKPTFSNQSSPPAVSRNGRLLRLWQQAQNLIGDVTLNRPAQSVLRQVHALADLFERFQELLRTKLRPGEVTYQRFLSSGTQGFEMITAELQEVVSRMEHFRSVEMSLRPTADGMVISQESFQQIQQEQLSKIDRLLSGTREAIAQLARVNFSIAEMRRLSIDKAGDITNAISELKDIAQRASRF